MKVKYIKLNIIYLNIILLMVLMKKKSKYSVGDLEYSVLDRSQSFANTQRYLEEVNTQYIDVTLDQIFYQLKEFQEQIIFFNLISSNLTKMKDYRWRITKIFKK